MHRGLFISFEGSEGCGKSTQIQRLADHFQQLEVPVLRTREPGGTAAGEEIRHLLQFSAAGDGMCPETELLLFAASRAQLVREVIEPALKAGTTVLADRFFDSTTVYQGIARRVETAAVNFINEFAVGKIRPDLTFVLDLEPLVARQRLLRRPRPVDALPDRMEQEPLPFYEKVRQGYLRLAETDPQRIRVLDASKSVLEIEAEIWRIIETAVTG